MHILVLNYLRLDTNFVISIAVHMNELCLDKKKEKRIELWLINDMELQEYILTALATKTVIFVTHQVEFLPAADLILV